MEKIIIKKAIILVIIGLSLLIPIYSYTVKGEIQSPKEESTEEESTVQPSSSNFEFLPNINWTFINSVEIVHGNDDAINNLTDLQFDDDNTYDLKGNWTGVQWEYEIYFSYEVDLNNYQLDYYDIYLFLDIEQSLTPSGVIEFQTYSSYNYVNLINITHQPISIEEHFLERTTKFRVIGNSSTDKVIKFDRLVLILAHEGSFNYTTQSRTVLKTYNYINDPYYFFWVSEFDPQDFKNFTIGVWAYSNHIYIINVATTHIYISMAMYMDFDFSSGVITGVTSGEFSIKHIWEWGTTANQGLGSMYIVLYKDPSYLDYRITRFMRVYDKYDNKHRLNTTDILCNSSYFETYWDQFITFNGSYSYISFNYVADSQGTIWLVDNYAYTNIFIDYVLCHFSFNGYNFSNPKHDYIRFLDVRIDPLSPIVPALNENFDLVTTVSSGFNDQGVKKIEFLIANDSWNSGWANLSYQVGNCWKSVIDSTELENGDYTVWLKGTDNNGYTTLEKLDIEIINGKPQIEFLAPSEDLEVVSQLHNYTISTYIIDPEGESFWEFEIPQVRIYQDELDPIVDWTDMAYNLSESPYIYNFTFDPIYLSNGNYTIEVRARDVSDYNYEKISIKIKIISEEDPLVVIIITTISIGGLLGAGIIMLLLRKRFKARRS